MFSRGGAGLEGGVGGEGSWNETRFAEATVVVFPPPLLPPLLLLLLLLLVLLMFTLGGVTFGGGLRTWFWACDIIANEEPLSGG
jgi:hypothetical protein